MPSYPGQQSSITSAPTCWTGGHCLSGTSAVPQVPNRPLNQGRPAGRPSGTCAETSPFQGNPFLASTRMLAVTYEHLSKDSSPGHQRRELTHGLGPMPWIPEQASCSAAWFCFRPSRLLQCTPPQRPPTAGKLRCTHSSVCSTVRTAVRALQLLPPVQGVKSVRVVAPSVNTALEQPAAGLLLQGLIGCRVLRRGRSGSAAVPRPAPRYAGA